MPPLRVLSVVGTRPNFMKIAPIVQELRRRPGEFEHTLVHTGQHYDTEMAGLFLTELSLDLPDHLLHVGSGSRAQQLARVVERLEPVLADVAPDLVIVPGDVNSTLAAALGAEAAGIPIAHVESGLRSFDRSMPEETNRVLTDALSAYLFTHSPEAEENLLREGCDPQRIHFVGNTMIDTLTAMLPAIDARGAAARLGLQPGAYLFVTLHRPALVDTELLAAAMEALQDLSRDYTIVFPVHPRTRARLDEIGFRTRTSQLRIHEALGYLDCLSLIKSAAAAITDSGGIQEETTFLGVPCITLRDNTERPVTVSLGTNVVIGLDPSRLAEVPSLIDEVRARKSSIPPLWDGRASERVADVLASAARGD